MTFSELTRLMLHSMDFFELRRTAARYDVPFQGVRRNKLVREIEKRIILKNSQLNDLPKITVEKTYAAQSPETTLDKLKKYRKQLRPILSTKINTFSSHDSQSRAFEKQN
jgi:hypothetical protein